MSTAGNLGWRLWDRLSVYLPIILMAVLALGTYWMVRNAPVMGDVATVAKPTHDPDYFMRGFSVRSFERDGRLLSEVFGAEARHYPDTDTLEIDQPRIRSTNLRNQQARATADRALTNGDASEVQLMGNAKVVRDGGVAANGQAELPMVFNGEYLHVFVKAEKIRSDKPVTLTRGADRFSANRMDYDNSGRVLQLHGQVRVVLAPAKSR